MSVKVRQTLDGIVLDGKTKYQGLPMYQADNIQALEIAFNFDEDNPMQEIQANSWDWSGGTYKYLYDKHEAAKTGGRSVFEGLDLSTRITYESGNFDQFNQSVTYEEAFWDDAKARLTTNVITKGRTDWFRENADAFNIPYLFEVGQLTDANIHMIPTVVDRELGPEDMVTIITLAFIVDKLQEAFTNISEKLAGLLNPLNAPTEAGKSIIFLAYLIGLLISLIDLLSDLFDLVVQPIKYNSGMFIIDQLRAAAEHMGKKFESSIFDSGPWNRLFLMPEKWSLPENTQNGNRILGLLKPDKSVQNATFRGSAGDLFRFAKSFTRGKYIITDDTIRLEREDFEVGTSTYQLPNIKSEGYTTNMSELIANYEVRFSTDVNDTQTLLNYSGTTFQVETKPSSVTDSNNLVMKGFESVLIPFARGVKKTSLNSREKLIQSSLKVIDAVLGLLINVANGLIKTANFFGANFQEIKRPKLVNIINERIGMLRVHSDVINIGKLMLITLGSTAKKNKISSDHEAILNAEYVYNAFHIVKEFVPSTAFPNANQWIDRAFSVMPFCGEDAEKVTSNSRIIDARGIRAFIRSLKWRPLKGIAVDVRYRTNELYDNSLIKVTRSPSGF